MIEYDATDDVKVKKFFESFKEQIGPTGRFPEGRFTEKDEGEIQFGITVVKGKVVLNFGSPIVWIGMTKEQALDLGESLIKLAEKI